MNAETIVAALETLRREGADFGRLLGSAVELVHEASPRFDWTGVYELAGAELRLGPFVGDATEHTTIPVGRGVCGTAVAERRNANVGDVRQAADYLACSIATRAELVVLIRRGARIYGQIDIDSHTAGAFDERIVAAVERVADWLAELYATRETVRDGVAR
jgi:GAF domain-containing protein